MWSRTVSTEKRDIYLNTAEYISGRRRPAELVTPIKALVQSRVNNEGKLTQVSLTNIIASDSGEVTLRLLNPISENAVLAGQYIEEKTLKLMAAETENLYEVAVEKLTPWAVTTIFLK